MSEDVPDYIPKFSSTEFFKMERGTVATVALDRERDVAAMDELAKSVVKIDGKLYQCHGIERFCHSQPWHKGEPVGLLVSAPSHTP